MLEKAAQPRHASGNACIKLCYFVEQCRNSKVASIRDVAFSEKTCLDLFNFYIEWNEKNQHRSMRQILELLSSLISLNPDGKKVDSVKETILRRLLSITTHQSAQPLVKPAFKSMESFLAKGTVSTEDLISCYEDHFYSGQSDAGSESDRNASWDSFISEVFEWLNLADVSPAAGKLLVTLFGSLRNESRSSQSTGHTVLWQRWIRSGLRKNPETLENVKNYLFPPLFKIDRSGSLLFLGDLNSQGPLSGLQVQDANAHSLLHLAAIEVGKKTGLVEDPSITPPLRKPFSVLMYVGTVQFQKDSKNSAKCVVLEEAIIGDLLTHASDTVRSLAFSVLVSCSSSIRPYSAVALNLLQNHLGILYADTDAKFRNDVLSNTRHMVERLRGGTAYLTRELESVKSLLSLDESIIAVSRDRNKALLDEISILLKVHEKFIKWYLEFLSGELIPTASYQRHITALKAIALLVRSGIVELDPRLPAPKVSDNSTVWPYSIKFFTSGTMRLILDLLMDPFEDVRINASVILKLASQNDFTLETHTVDAKTVKETLLHPKPAIVLASIATTSDLQHLQSSNSESKADHIIPHLLLDFIDRGQDLSKRTGRADYADGVARSYEILYELSSSMEARLALVENLVQQLEMKVKISEVDLAQAVLEAPIHGNFAALKYVRVVHISSFADELSEALSGSL